MTSDHFGLSESILDPSLVVENSDESQVASTKESVQFITKIDRMKTHQGESRFLKVDVNGETVRVFGRPEEVAEHLEASGYGIPASEMKAEWRSIFLAW